MQVRSAECYRDSVSRHDVPCKLVMRDPRIHHRSRRLCKAFHYIILYGHYAAEIYTYFSSIPSTPHSFISGLKPSFSVNPSHRSIPFYRAMLRIRGTSHGPVSVRLSVRLSVRPSVRPSQVGVLLKRLNVGSHKQHRTIAQGL